MAIVVELSEQAGRRVSAAAQARGVTESQIVEELIETLRLEVQAPSTSDPLTSFIGCGASGDRRDRSLDDLRDDLSAAQLADRESR